MQVLKGWAENLVPKQLAMKKKKLFKLRHQFIEIN